MQPLHPDKIALENIDVMLVSKGGLARVFVGTVGIPLLGNLLLLDAKVSAIDRHETIVQLVADKTDLEANLWFCERAMAMRGGSENTFGEGVASKKVLPLCPQAC